MAEQDKAPFSPLDIQRRWDQGNEWRQEIDREVWENIAFIKGDQWAVWDKTTRRFVRPDGKDGRTRLKVNLVKSLWRSEQATILEGKPIPEVFSVSTEEGDQARARAANRILEHELRRLNWEDVKGEVLMWVTAAGHAYLHPYWSKLKNDACVEVVPHFELVVDPSVRRSTTEATWVIHGKVLTAEAAYDRFGREFTPQDRYQVVNYSRIFEGHEGKAREGGVQVLRVWHLPTKRYPNGFVKTVVNGECVEDLPWPYQHREIPYVDIHHVRLPGRYEGQSVIVDLIAPQKDYNATRSRMAELRALHAPRVFAPEGSLDIERLSGDVAGEVVTWRPVGPFEPKIADLPNVPSFLFNEANQAFQEMQDISSQHEVSRGSVPSSGIPASGIVALQEKDERRVALTIGSLEQATVRTSRQLLALVNQYWDTQRKVRIWSEKTGEMSVELLSGSDVAGEMDVYIVPGSSVPRSKAALRQDVLGLWDRRVIQDPRAVLKVIELPTNLGLDVTFDQDTKQAKREHDRMFSGELVVAEMWHNHDIHVEEHNAFRKSEVFEQEWDETLRAFLNDHVEEHEEARRQLAFEAMQEQLVASGGVPELTGEESLSGPEEAAPVEGAVPQPAEAGPPGV